MYVCICRQITDGQIRERCREGRCSLPEICAELGIASECGKCAGHARMIVTECAAGAGGGGRGA